MPVYKLAEEMPYTELLKWISFFKERPQGWREDFRTFMLLKAQGVKESQENLFPSLKQMKINTEKSQEPDRAVPKGNLLQLMLKAKGQEDWPLIKASKNDQSKS